MRFAFLSKVKSQKIDAATEQLLEIQGRKKELEIEVQQLSLKISNMQEQSRQTIAQAKHEHSLEMTTLKLDLYRQKKLFEEDKTRLLAKHKEEHDLKLLELKTLSKLEAQQEVAQAKLSAQKQVQDLTSKHTEEVSKLKTVHAEELGKVKSELAAQYYTKMQEALKDITLHGTEQSKFLKELAMEMVSKSLEKPMPAHHINETRLVTAGTVAAESHA